MRSARRRMPSAGTSARPSSSVSRWTTQRPAVLRALALRWMTDIDESSHFSELLQLARKSDPTLQLEALRRLATSRRPESTETLRAIARDAATAVDGTG